MVLYGNATGRSRSAIRPASPPKAPLSLTRPPVRLHRRHDGTDQRSATSSTGSAKAGALAHGAFLPADRARASHEAPRRPTHHGQGCCTSGRNVTLLIAHRSTDLKTKSNQTQPRGFPGTPANSSPLCRAIAAACGPVHATVFGPRRAAVTVPRHDDGHSAPSSCCCTDYTSSGAIQDTYMASRTRRQLRPPVRWPRIGTPESGGDQNRFCERQRRPAALL